MKWRILTNAKQNWDLKTVIFNGFVFLIIAIILIFLVHGIYTVATMKADSKPVVDNGIFVGNTPIEIYTVFDKETGVYYAVTEKGGICVMETMDEGVKLVDQGDNGVIHHNMGNGEN